MNNPYRGKPLSAFYIYLFDVKDTYKQAYPTLTFPHLTAKMSDDWRMLENHEKEEYNNRAKTMLLEYRARK